MKGLTDIAGIRVGHATDFEALTGVSVILTEAGAVAGADIRGGAAGTEEFEALNPLHVTGAVHAVVLAGGSAFGLEAASGVRQYLEGRGVGFPTSAARVPIVPAAIIYDLGIGKADIRPSREMGLAAAHAADAGPVAEGAVGAGAGATVGKIFGMQRAMKSGLGSFTVALGGRYQGVMVSALAVVNAFGDVLDPATGKILAGARKGPHGMEFAGTAEAMKRGGPLRQPFQENTTLAVVATNARLTKVQAVKVAQLAQHGMVRTICPVHTMFDGDLVIALSLGAAQADVNAVGLAAAEALEGAILRAVRLAPSVGGAPGLAGPR